uniref:Secreted protein n=1 Tax=Caenorhabditis tropicalis TaxID=1561998 RepID=A0A1I7TEP6_9PELO
MRRLLILLFVLFLSSKNAVRVLANRQFVRNNQECKYLVICVIIVWIMVLDDISIPSPEIIVHDEHSVSAVVPRFFQEPPFDVIKPSFLYLLALFTKNGSECSSFGHIEAYQRNEDKCLLRIRVQMPKIDYTGTDNYYYDDRSSLESQFSRDLFGNAENVTFWNEVTVRRDEKINNGSLGFATVLKSSRIDFML